MCGRYTLIKLADLVAYFPWIGSPAIMPEARYNIAPSQDAAVVTNETPEPKIDFIRWGLVPSWAKDGSISAGSRMINARAETLATKPAFSRLLKRQRCLVAGDGFFEWQANPNPKAKTKIPWCFRMKDEKPFAFAGLWDRWTAPDGKILRTFTIITTSANSVVAPVHQRMPAMLRNEFVQRWLSPSELQADELQQMLQPYPAGEMISYPVSTSVNSPARDEPSQIEPVEIAPQPPPFQPELF